MNEKLIRARPSNHAMQIKLRGRVPDSSSQKIGAPIVEKKAMQQMSDLTMGQKNSIALPRILI